MALWSRAFASFSFVVASVLFSRVNLLLPSLVRYPFLIVTTMAVPPPKSPVWDARYLTAVPHDKQYYAKCMFGGVLACGLTHALITPLDVTKCNMQVTHPPF